MKNSEQPLWDRERQQLRPRTDIFYQQVNRLEASMGRAQKSGLLKRGDDKGLYTPIASFSLESTVDSKASWIYYSAEAHTRENKDMTYLAVSKKEGVDGKLEKRYYQVLEVGTVVDLDSNSAVEIDSDDYDVVSKSLSAVTLRTSELVSEYEHAQRERRALVRNIAIGTAATSLVAGGVFFGLRKAVFEPAEANERYRHVYDGTQHVLPGDGAELTAHSFGRIAAKDFDKIPTYGGDDKTLDQPRIVDVGYDNYCASVDTKLTGNRELYAALPSDSPYLNYRFNVTSTADGFQVCLDKDLPDDSTASDIPVALQIR